jgi:hypothetical protein
MHVELDGAHEIADIGSESRPRCLTHFDPLNMYALFASIAMQRTDEEHETATREALSMLLGVFHDPEVLVATSPARSTSAQKLAVGQEMELG